MVHKRIRYSPILLFARIAGLGAAAIVTVLWSVLLFVPANKEGITGGTYVVGAVMIALALLAVWGVLAMKPWTLVLAFVGSFVPVGLYALGLPGVFRFVGYANLLFLFAGVLIAFEQYRMRRR